MRTYEENSSNLEGAMRLYSDAGLGACLMSLVHFGPKGGYDAWIRKRVKGVLFIQQAMYARNHGNYGIKTAIWK